MTFEQFCEPIPDEKKPPLDRESKTLDAVLSYVPIKAGWRDYGHLVLPNIIPHDPIDAYCERYQRDNGERSRVGYRTGTPYMTVPEIKEIGLYKPLVDILDSLIGEPVGMSLNLTDWQSTERNWHQDDYLNPEHVNGHYLAVWIALDDIHPDSGPFEFVPGSHKWPVMRMEKVKSFLDPHERNDPNWPRIAERFLDDVFEAEIEKRNAEIKVWNTAKKGDVLIWHSWLAHRGSRPKNPDLLRKSLIIHYSGINHRQDMSEPILHESEKARGYFFPF